MVSKKFLDDRRTLANFGQVVIHILLLFSILRVSTKTNRKLYVRQSKSEEIIISSELITLPVKLCYVWVFTRDVTLRKYNLPVLPCNIRHRYGLNLQISRKISHAAILLLLGRDIATNPGPPKTSNGYNIQCLYLNSRSLINKTNELQTLAIDIDLLAVTETWLLKPENLDSEILPGKLRFHHSSARQD